MQALVFRTGEALQPRSPRARRRWVVVAPLSVLVVPDIDVPEGAVLLVVDVVVEVDGIVLALVDVPALLVVLVVPVAAGYGVVPPTVGAALPLSVGAAAGPLVVAVPPVGVAPRPVPAVPALVVPVPLVVVLGIVLGLALGIVLGVVVGVVVEL